MLIMVVRLETTLLSQAQARAEQYSQPVDHDHRVRPFHLTAPHQATATGYSGMWGTFSSLLK